MSFDLVQTDFVQSGLFQLVGPATVEEVIHSPRLRTLGTYRVTLLQPTMIEEAIVTPVTTDPIIGMVHMKSATVIVDFDYNHGGTSVDVWIQTSIDAGVTWIDIINFNFTTSSAIKVSSVKTKTALSPAITPTDGTLGSDLIVSGLLGDRIRAKYQSSGTYGNGTTLAIDLIVKS